MSSRRLWVWTVSCSIWLFIYASLYIYAAIYSCPWKDTLESLIPMALAIPGALLLHAFNRRNSYLQAMRDLWQRLIPAVQTAIQYTHLSPPDAADFARTQEALSTAIDMLRGVFANVPTSRQPPGLYPYENLKDIHKIIAWLDYGSRFRLADAEQARRCMVRLWQEMHVAMLDEFDRDMPKRPVSKYLGDGWSIADHLFNGTLVEHDLQLEIHASYPRQNKDQDVTKAQASE